MCFGFFVCLGNSGLLRGSKARIFLLLSQDSCYFVGFQVVCRLSVWATLIYSDVQKSLMRAQGLWPPLGSLQNSTGLHRLLMVSKLFHTDSGGPQTHLFGDSGLLTGANATYDSPRRLYSPRISQNCFTISNVSAGFHALSYGFERSVDSLVWATRLYSKDQEPLPESPGRLGSTRDYLYRTYEVVADFS